MTGIQRLACRGCGDSIHPDTAARNDGLCMPCKGGWREAVEEGRRQRERERERVRSPEHLYWRALVGRVHASPGAFARLPAAERTYYALRCLIGEVCSGGFYSLFANCRPGMYGVMIDGLLELAAPQADEALAQLTEAKELLLGPGPVPLDPAEVDALLPDLEMFEQLMPEREARLREVDTAFWAGSAGLDVLCTRYAQAQGLYPQGA